MDGYPTTYTDDRGSETTTLFNDYKTLRVSLRGLEFTGTDFDSLEPPQDVTPEQLAQFSLHHNCLCSCRIQCRIPVPIEDHSGLINGHLAVNLVLGDPKPNGQLDREQLQIVLEYDNQRVAGSGTSGWFEDELLAI